MNYRSRIGFALVSVACSGGDAEAPAPVTSQGGDGGSVPSSEDAGAPCVTSVVAKPGTVLTTQGPMTGSKTGSVWSWKGIPFAAPPVGDLRFKPPQPAACVVQERMATAFGAKCIQLDPDSKAIVGSEDCLTLNVWAPEGAADAPVLAYIHGGGNTTGTASDPLYDGAALAGRTGSIVVTFEYRLGALGFLTTESLNKESAVGVSGNYGILDQIAALKWIQANIRGFGGAPARVMLFGESAGAQDTLVHIASPLSKGLFASAGVESGGVYKSTLSQNIPAMAPFLASVGCSGASDVNACLRSKSAADIAAVPAAEGPLDKGMRYVPVVDGYVLKDNSLNVIASGAHNHVPVIIGTNADETSRMVAQVSTEAEYAAAVRAQYPQPPGAAEALLGQYPASAYASPRKALIALTTDATWTCPIRRLSRALAAKQSEPVYRYYFTWSVPNAAGRLIGATHGLELPFVFGTFSALSGYTPQPSETTLSDAMQGYWSRLAKGGDVNDASTLAWPRTNDTDPYMIFDTTMRADIGLAKANCDFIEALAQ